MVNPNMVFTIVVLTVCVHSRTVPVEYLYINKKKKILYQLLLQMQLNQFLNVDLLKRIVMSMGALLFGQGCPKLFVRLGTLKFVVYNAVLCFNDGVAKKRMMS